MYNGPLRRLEIRFQNSLTDVVIDRFGDAARLTDRGDGSFTASLEVKVSPVFFGWLMNFGTQAKILSPPDVARQYAEAAAAVAQMYKEGF